MNIKIKHFTQLAILTIALAVLWYFYSKAKTFGIIAHVEKSERNCEFCDHGSTKLDKTSHLHARAYRQNYATKFRARGLRWIENDTTGFVDKGNALMTTIAMLGNTTTEDPTKADCSDVHKTPAADRCNFVTVTDACQMDDGFINYMIFAYCQVGLVPGISIMAVWLLFLFIGLAITADDYFCPSLAVISNTMRLSHNIAGVTFLAFGNGAPDIFSAIAAIGSAKDGNASLAIGALFGAGIFVTTVVAGFIAIICPFDAMQRPFLRDVIFYLGAVFWTFVILWDRRITRFEAIGFILLYVMYVVVVVLGRYIYTRQRQSRPEDRNIQESSGVPFVNPLDTVTDDESQPLLSNPDVISLTAVRDQSAGAEFLHSINPIDTELWSGTGLLNILKRIYDIFKSPIMFLLIVTVPVVNYEDDKHHWNRHLQCLQCVLGPVFGVIATKVGFILIGGTFPVWALTLILGIMLAAIVFFTSKNEEQPKYHAVFAYLGFVIAVVWIYCIANEIVNILKTVGVVFHLSDAILGLTFLAWGNSIGDFIADSMMAKQGYPRMGISACFGGPLFNLLLGIGIPFTIATVKEGDFKIKLTLDEVVLAFFLGLSLVSSLVIVTVSKFRMSRPWGIYLVVLYLVFLTVAILTEVKVIHYEIDPGA